MRRAYDGLRKRRLDEFMAGFNAISLKLKEMYQMITLGGDAELELVDSLDPFSEARAPRLLGFLPWLSACRLLPPLVVENMGQAKDGVSLGLGLGRGSAWARDERACVGGSSEERATGR